MEHLEREAQDKGRLPERMFRYFSRLWDRYGLPVYPIALLSFEGKTTKPDRYQLRFHDLRMLDYRYRTVQLNRLRWRLFVDRPNPVASALMTRMSIRPADRPKVKLECLQLLATLRLDATRSRLISQFVYSYLRLNASEARIYQQNLEPIQPAERQTIMQWTNEWIEEGREQGLAAGHERGLAAGLREGITALLHRLYGKRAAESIARLQRCNLATLQRLQQQLADGAELEQLDF